MFFVEIKMKKLTIKKAEKLSKKYLLKNKRIDPYHYVHTLNVVQAIKIISKKKEVNKKELLISAWIHDIGYAFNNAANNYPDHAKNTINLLKKEGYEINKTVRDCIMNHGSKGNPKTKEGKLLQISVKFNIVDKNFLKYLIEERASGREVEFLKKRAESAVKMLERFKSLRF
jgi:HD superfamily phosphodiesterase